MAIQEWTPVPPTGVKRVVLAISKDDAGAYKATYRVVLEDENGNVIRAISDEGNYIPLLTPEETTSLQAVIDGLMAKAQSLLPTG